MAGHALLRLGAGNRPGIVDLGNRALDTVQFSAVGGQVLAVQVQLRRIGVLRQELLGNIRGFLISQLDRREDHNGKDRCQN